MGVPISVKICVYSLKDETGEFTVVMLRHVHSHENGQKDHVDDQAYENCKRDEAHFRSSNVVTDLAHEWSDYHIEETVVNQYDNGDDKGEGCAKLRVNYVRFANFTCLRILVIQSELLSLFQRYLIEAIGSVRLECCQQPSVLIFIITEAGQRAVDVLRHEGILVFGFVKRFPGIVGLLLVLDSGKIWDLVANLHFWVIVVHMQAIMVQLAVKLFILLNVSNTLLHLRLEFVCEKQHDTQNQHDDEEFHVLLAIGVFHVLPEVVRRHLRSLKLNRLSEDVNISLVA